MQSAVQVVILAVAVAVAAMSSPCSAADPQISDPVRSVATFLSNLLQTHGSEFKQLASERKYDEAAAVWGRHRQFFEERNDDYKDSVGIVAKGLNARFEGAISGPLARIKAVTEDPSLWLTLESDRAAVEEALTTYQKILLVQKESLQSPILANTRIALRDLDRALEQFAPKAFSEYDHFSRESFFKRYPVNLAAGFLAANFESLKPRLGSASEEQLLRFIEAYGTALGEAEKTYLASVYVAGQDRSPARVVRAVTALARLGIATPKDAAVDVVELTLDGTPRDETFTLSVRADPPLAARSIGTDELDATLTATQGITMLVTVREGTIDRKVTDRGRVTSSYVAGQDTLPNPAYEQARLRYVQAQAQHQQQELSNSLNPPRAPLVAILQGVASGVAAAARDTAFAEFSATAPTISKPRFASYQVETAGVTVRKEGTIAVVLIDHNRGTMTEFTQPFVEERRFSLAYGIREDDESRATLMRQFQTEGDVTAFEQRTETIALVDLLKTLEDTQPSSTPVSLAGLRASLIPQTTVAARQSHATSAPVALAEDARFDSVVVVKTGSGAGAGFFIGQNLVITNDHVVQAAGFAEIKLRDGREVYGKVIKRDPDADLALIRVAADIPALQLSDGSLKPGQPVEAIGHPRGLNYSLTRGVISAIRKRPLPGMRGVTLIQTDTAINPGNSGGPLLDGDKVVGINTMKFREAEGIGFAVHAQEIQRFISP